MKTEQEINYYLNKYKASQRFEGTPKDLKIFQQGEKSGFTKALEWILEEEDD